MCGIFIEINKKRKPINKDRFINCLKLINHRGPDSFGTYWNDDIAIGHNRLKITGDLGEQPFIYNNIVSVVNGEFYDYKNIKKNFEQEGFQFKTNTDSEIIIPLYKKYGIYSPQFWNSLNGEFSFCIYDQYNKKIYLARDPYGVKPLYYYIKEEEIFISSEIKAFLGINKLSWNYKSLKSVLIMQYHNTEETLFDSVFQVEPGELLCIDLNDYSIKKEEYWKNNFFENENFSNEKHFNDLKEEVYHTMYKSVSRRIEGQKNFACTLSGGIDSSIIFGLSSIISGKSVDSYTISFSNGGNYDELKSAELMCKKYNGNFNPIFVNGIDLIDNFEKSIFASEQVSINGHLPSKYILFNKIKENGHNISLSGEGSDELFLGYSHFRNDLNINFSNQDYLKGIQLSDNLSFENELLFNEYRFIPDFIKAKFSIGDKIKNKFLINDFISKEEKSTILKNLFLKYDFLNSNINPVYKSSLLWSKICLSNYILNGLGDKLEMSSSIEGRVPFLDKDLIRLSQRIPTAYKMNQTSEKFILKEAFKDIVTKDIYSKTKHPFIAPSLLNWSDNYIYEHIQDIINSSDLIAHDFFCSSTLRKSIQSLKEEKDKNTKNSYEAVILLFLSLYYIEKLFIK